MPRTASTRPPTGIPASVPGNVELDLIAARRLPENLEQANNVYLVQAYEKHRWWYRRRFTMPALGAGERAVLVFEGNPLFQQILIWLATLLLACAGSMLLSSRWPLLAALLLGVEIAATLALTLLSAADFFVFLFAIPCMQVMQRFNTRGTAVVLGLTTLLTMVALMPGRGVLFAVGMAVVYFGGTVLLTPRIV